MRIPNNLHYQKPWRVHALADDFALEDVWQFPIEDDPNNPRGFAAFRETFKDAVEAISQTGPAGFLFRLRVLLGKWFKWDTAAAKGSASDSNSLLYRYGKTQNPEGLSIRDAQPNQGASADGFLPVYALEQETLSEIANKTVHAALHLSWVQLDSGNYTARLAVYVRSMSPLTRWYMLLIRPFRYWIVYPAILRRTGQMWQAQESNQNLSVS